MLPTIIVLLAVVLLGSLSAAASSSSIGEARPFRMPHTTGKDASNADGRRHSRVIAEHDTPSELTDDAIVNNILLFIEYGLLAGVVLLTVILSIRAVCAHDRIAHFRRRQPEAPLEISEQKRAAAAIVQPQ